MRNVVPALGGVRTLQRKAGIHTNRYHAGEKERPVCTEVSDLSESERERGLPLSTEGT